ncbi:MAG: hypothetical protein HOI53_07700 [Francisellaceae bacterium]|nr:hypothetical protein [Francisellaceae bacterium]MBT6207897.1 hypothetical protein [Francisellaceae bacterium]MBT6538860.1 hypothetical protein [Francisellaceae bacterium]
MLSKFFNKKEEEHQSLGLVIISYSIQGASVIVCSQDKGLKIQEVTFFDREISGSVNTEEHSLKPIIPELKAYIEENKLQGYDCAVVLNPNEYVMKMLDKPKLPEEEIKDALKFAMQDFISYGFDNCIIDYVSLPEQRRSDSAEMVFAVAMDKNKMIHIDEMIKKQG